MDEFLCQNPNESNFTRTDWLVEDKRSGQIAAAFLLLILLVGLPWNLLVIITAIKERLYKQPTIVLLLNLVVTDVVLLVLVIPLQIVVGFSGEFILGDTNVLRCKLCQLGALRMIFELMSLYAIAFIAFDRFLFIYKPLRYDKLFTIAKTLLVLAVGWIIAIIITILPFLGFGAVVFYLPFVSCRTNIHANHGIAYFAVLFVSALLPVLAVVVFNAWLVCIVWKNIRAIYTARKSLQTAQGFQVELQKSMKKKRHQKEWHMIQVFGALLVCNAISWVPSIIFTLYLFIARPDTLSVAVLSTIHVFFNAQAVLHPLIETWLIRDIREPIKKLFCCCCLGRRKLRLMSCKCGCVELIHAALFHSAEESQTTIATGVNSAYMETAEGKE